MVCILYRNVIFYRLKILWQLGIEVEVVHEIQVVVPLVVLGALLSYFVHQMPSWTGAEVFLNEYAVN
jgi:hypothetical protein